jgi:hypothetical protein
MINRQRNVLLLAVIFAVAAGVLLMLPRQTPPVSIEQSSASAQAGSAKPFATMRSLLHQSAEEIAEHEWLRSMRDSMNSEDRCAAFAEIIKNSLTAQRAVDWAKTIDDQSNRNMALDSIACAWGKCDPKAGVQWALSITDDPLTKSALITTIFASWAAQDAKAASEYATKMEQADQTYAIAAVAPALAANNPKEAVQWAQSLSEEDARNLAGHYVVNTWAASQPADAAEWALTLPDGFNRADYVKTIVQKWLESDAAAAVEWVRQLPKGTSRDSALDLIASQFTDSDPSFAANYTENIGRTELRDARVEALIAKWLNKDPNAARAWLQNAPVSDSKKTALVSPQ